MNIKTIVILFALGIAINAAGLVGTIYSFVMSVINQLVF